MHPISRRPARALRRRVLAATLAAGPAALGAASSAPAQAPAPATAPAAKAAPAAPAAAPRPSAAGAAAVPAVPAAPSHRGLWVTDGGKSQVEVSDCGPGICARIVWLRDPNDSQGRPWTDLNNEDPKLRTRPVVGLSLFDRMMPVQGGGWAGKVYNPEDGGTFDVNVWLAGTSQIKIKGCVLFICQTHTWMRAEGPAAAVMPGATPGAPPAAVPPRR